MRRKRASQSRIRIGRKFARQLTLEVLEDRRLLAIDFNLLKDINPAGASSRPLSFAEVGSVLFFVANDGTSGYELWKSDGTQAGTILVKDVLDETPGSLVFAPSYLTNVGGTLYFTADDGTSGTELWKSDGTEAGTVRVKDIRAGSVSSGPRYLTNVSGTLYFTANDGASGYDLWKSDGTQTGTVRVKDIFGAYYFSTLFDLTNVGGILYFTVNDGTSGDELWKSDGTEAGTNLVKDVRAGTESSQPSYLTNVGGTLFFAARDDSSGGELWKSDGTAAGTVRVKDISTGLSSSSPGNFTNVGGTLYFTANDGTSGLELWKSNGTEAGTIRVKDIRAGAEPTSWFEGPFPLANVGGILYFQANDGMSGRELWKTDGTEVGTGRVKDIWAGAEPTFWLNGPRYVKNVEGMIYFTANDGTNGAELWQSDGTEAGTVLVKDFTGDSTSSAAAVLTVVNGRLFVVATTTQYGQEIWVADLSPPSLAGDYNANGSVDAADYVLWRNTLGSTVDLRANGDDTGASAGVIDQADYAVWRGNFGASGGSGAGGLGLGTDGGARSEERGASGGSVELGVGSGEGAIASGELGVGSGEFGVAIKDASRLASVNGDSPSPRPSPGGRGGIGMATRGSGNVVAAAFAAERDLLLLLSVGMCDEKSEVRDAQSLASADLAPTSAEVAELAALDIVFAGVGQGEADD